MTGGFDGTWFVTLNMRDYKDPVTGTVAQGYTINFVAKVKNGVLQAEHKNPNGPDHFEMNGKIEPDGTATLHLSGITGSPKYTMGNPLTGMPYNYDIDTHFKARSGTGKRIGPRIGIFDFVKEE
jgi:hypothetical protein